jgi:hypothetical protein
LFGCEYISHGRLALQCLLQCSTETRKATVYGAVALVVLLLDVARRLLVGCEEGSWATAMPAATGLVMVSPRLQVCLRGSDQAFFVPNSLRH